MALMNTDYLPLLNSCVKRGPYRGEPRILMSLANSVVNCVQRQSVPWAVALPLPLTCAEVPAYTRVLNA